MLCGHEVEFIVLKHVVCDGYCVLGYGAMKSGSYRSFVRTFFLCYQEGGGNRFPIKLASSYQTTLKMVAVGSSEALLASYQTARCHVVKDRSGHGHS